MDYWDWKPYVSVAERRLEAERQMEKLRKQGREIRPVRIDGRVIARSFWGKGWCEHLELFSDYENRLPRGRTYVRNGSVCHLEIHAGRVEAMVAGSSLYSVKIDITPLAKGLWQKVRQQCAGQIGSMIELLQGRFSDNVMTVVSHPETGLFPHENQIKLNCSCPDWATMCKHVAAVLYGIGNRLDVEPELLFLLRGVDAAQLISTGVALPSVAGADAPDTLADDGLSAIFGIDLEAPAVEQPVIKGKDAPTRRRAKAGVRTSKRKAAPPVEAESVKPRRAEARSEAPVRRKFKTTRPHKPTAATSTVRNMTDPSPVKRKPKPAGKSVAPTAKTRGHQSPKWWASDRFDPSAPTGAAIVRMRIKANLTQTKFAKAIGASAASVQRWESTPGTLRIHGRILDALKRFAK